MRQAAHRPYPLVLSAAAAAALLAGCERGVAPDVLAAGGDAALGAAIHTRHCSVCHGETGRADGLAAPHLLPPARDFATGRFRLTSTENGRPTAEDVAAVLRRGMPGSAMPSFDWLGDTAIADLAAHVLSLSLEGYAAELLAEAALDDEELTGEDARAIAALNLSPGPVVEPGPAAEPTEHVLARGEVLYLDRCAVCHGADGRGLPGDPKPAEDGSLAWARDFTAGFLKGGTAHADLAMPAIVLADPDDEAALVAWVRRLIPLGSEDRLLTTRGELRAARVDAPVPREPADAAWERAVPLRVGLTPLYWTEEAVMEVELRALHDDVDLAVRVRWADDTRDNRLSPGAQHVDAVSLQLSSDARPPLIGMGSEDRPHDLWHWKAADLANVRDALLWFESIPHRLVFEPLSAAESATIAYLPTLLQPTDAEEAAVRTGAGIGVVEAVQRGLEHLEARANYSQGAWEVVLVRSLDPPEGNGVWLAGGHAAQLACAVWNGSAGDGGVRRSALGAPRTRRRSAYRTRCSGRPVPGARSEPGSRRVRSGALHRRDSASHRPRGRPRFRCRRGARRSSARACGRARASVAAWEVGRASSSPGERPRSASGPRAPARARPSRRAPRSRRPSR
jgi:mono/diheme cytochrome c family protein